jgi:serine protease
MYRHSRLAVVFGCAMAFAVAGCASNSAMTPAAGGPAASALVQSGSAGWIHSGGVVYHTPKYMATRSNVTPAVSGILFNYNGGVVLTKPKAYLILWGYKKYGDPDAVAKLLKSYLKAMGGSPYTNIYTQYYQKISNKQTNITNPKKQFGGVWDDETNAVPSNPTDAQVAAESLQGVAHFGYNANASYIVATPTGHSSSGFGTEWCAYHSDTFQGSNMVSYTNLPYMPDAAGNCGANYMSPPSDESGTDEGVTIVEGHEYGESVTDPNPGAGWYNNQYGEIGDACAWTNIQNDKFRKKTYTAQPMYSNASESCVHSYN